MTLKMFATMESLGVVNMREGDAWKRGCCQSPARSLLMGPGTMKGRRVDISGTREGRVLRRVSHKARFVAVFEGTHAPVSHENLFMVPPDRKEPLQCGPRTGAPQQWRNRLWRAPSLKSPAGGGAIPRICGECAAGHG